MTKTERTLHRAASQRWPGSEEHLVTVYRAVKPDRRIGAAARIGIILTDPAKRGEMLLALEDYPHCGQRGRAGGAP